MTFDLFADTFACPACSGYCNCSLCAPRRGEKYVPERDGGWRSWIAQQGGGCLTTVPPSRRAFATNTKTNKSKTPVKATPAPASAKKRAPKTTTTPTAVTSKAPVFDPSWSSTSIFTVSGEPLDHAFLHGNTAHVVLVLQQPTIPLSPPASPSATSSTPETRNRTNTNAKASTCVYLETTQGVRLSRVSSGPRARPTRAENDKGEAAVGAASESDILSGSSSRCYWRASRGGSSDGGQRR